jgi:2-polyprenyl-3-methyl-5-hydroxy-6-metoxy-1,4-benzoquinol methylase
MAINKQTVELFDRTAEQFARQIDSVIDRGTYVRGRLFHDSAKLYCEPGALILDYGCGPGRISQMLVRSGFRVLGLDCSTEMINQAKLRGEDGADIRFALLGETGTEFEPDTYGGIVCSSVIEYVDTPGKVLQSFVTALRPGGVLIISYASSTSLWRRYIAYHHDRHPHLKIQNHLWNWREAKRIFTNAGFEIVSGPIAFESPFDNYRFLKCLSRLSLIGTLGFVVLRKPRA